MKRILKKLILLCFIIFLPVVLLFLEYASAIGRNELMASSIDKHKQLDALPSPKIIVVGGSSAAFGVDSTKISEELNMPTINMAIARGIGLRFMLSEIEGSAKEGDIIILTPEYEHFYGDLNGTGGIIELFIVNPSSMKYLSHPMQVMKIFAALPLYIQGRLHFFIKRHIPHRVTSEEAGANPSYKRSSFNIHGDFVAHLDQTQPIKKRIQMFSSRPYEKETIIVIKDFVRRMNEKKVSVYFSFPPINEETYNKNEQHILNEERVLLDQIPEILLNHPTDVVFPDSQMFDSPYHLHKEARSLRTQDLIEAIQDKSLNLANSLKTL